MAMPSRSRSHYDAVVVGARVAGAATAMLLARAGASVLLLDRQAYGSDRISTHALMRGGVMLLQKWGVLSELVASGAPRVKQTSFIYGGEAVTLDIKPEGEVDHLIAPRRMVLDRILVDAAARAGAHVRHGVTLRELVYGRNGSIRGCRVSDKTDRIEEISAGIVIGADGRQSTVAGLVDARTYRQGNYCTGCVYGYFDNIPDEGYRWYFGDRTAAGAIPTNDGRHCVFAGVPASDFAARFKGNLEGGLMAMAEANSSELARMLASAGRSERLRGFVGCPGYFRQSWGPGWALVGDAGYFKDPLTAHGITDALRDAHFLADAVLAGGAPRLAGYQQKRDKLSSDLFEVTDAVASFKWNMEEIKSLHFRLSNAMKAECEMLSTELQRPTRLAA